MSNMNPLHSFLMESTPRYIKDIISGKQKRKEDAISGRRGTMGVLINMKKDGRKNDVKKPDDRRYYHHTKHESNKGLTKEIDSKINDNADGRISNKIAVRREQRRLKRVHPHYQEPHLP